MTQDIYINDSGDFEQDDRGNVSVVSGMDEIAQSCKIALNTRKGGWTLDGDEGLDWSSVIGSNVHDQFVTVAIRDCLLEDPRIDEISLISFDRSEKRVLKVSIKIEVNNQLKEITWETGDIDD